MRTRSSDEREVVAASWSRPAFPGGFPSDETAQCVRDERDYSRALEAYRFFYPTVSMEAIFQGLREALGEEGGAALFMTRDPRHIVFTGSSDAPLLMMMIDLLQHGPAVIEIPPGTCVGTVNDHNFHWTADLGIAAPDGGRGGRVLLLPPGYSDPVPSGYDIARPDAYKVLLSISALPADGDFAEAARVLQLVKVYGLAEGSVASPMRFVDVTHRAVDLTPLRWEDNLLFWSTLHRVITGEPAFPGFRPMYGLLAALGIEKGMSFDPDARMANILRRASHAGRNHMLVAGFASVRDDRVTWHDRNWEWPALCCDDGNFERGSSTDLEARDRWFAHAVGASPTMFARSQWATTMCWIALRDGAGDYLDGGASYRLTIPLRVPTRYGWSVTVYDAETRSQIVTPQMRAALRSTVELRQLARMTSVDLYFGPDVPLTGETRSIRTQRGRGWFAYLRLYGPERPALDGTWRPEDILGIP